MLCTRLKLGAGIRIQPPDIAGSNVWIGLAVGETPVSPGQVVGTAKDLDSHHPSLKNESHP